MITFILTILCLNIDALSYGISYGLSRKKIHLAQILLITTMSTIMFAIPLAISKYICHYFSKKLLQILNAIILIILGFSYIIKKQEKIEEKKQAKFSFKTCFFECVAISVDAIFTAILSAFSTKFYIFSIIFYAFTNFFAIFLGDMIFYKFGTKSRINLSFFSGFIFIILGIFKFIGF